MPVGLLRFCIDYAQKDQPAPAGVLTAVREQFPDLSESDLIIPPSDLSLEEAKELFSGEGLIPDLPTAG